MPTEDDLFSEEQTMVTMSFGDHLEELRLRLILALLGLFAGTILMLIPPLSAGMRIMRFMQEPAHEALTKFYHQRAIERSAVAELAEVASPPMVVDIRASEFLDQLRSIAPNLALPKAVSPTETISFPVVFKQSDLIKAVAESSDPTNAVISLTPLETVTVFLMVCLVAGLVCASPWVFYQIWAFIAAGLYRHERKYVYRLLPFSIGLFLGGVFLCFFAVLPITIRVLLEFNVWLGVQPTWRLSDWMSFATLLPLVFGACFQTPLLMLFLSRIGLFSVQQYRDKRKFAILIMVVIAAVLTPDPTVISQFLLALPMIALYELGIILVERGQKAKLGIPAESRA